jgi:hypothetical protein
MKASTEDANALKSRRLVVLIVGRGFALTKLAWPSCAVSDVCRAAI